MNLSDPLKPPVHAFRVGCALDYQAEAPTAVFLKVEPYPGPAQVLVDHTLTLWPDTPIERHYDGHGNATLGLMLAPGVNRLRYDAIIHCSGNLLHGAPSLLELHGLPADVWMYTFPSRYCESDKLSGFASAEFGAIAPGLARATAICDWTRRNLEYRYGSGDASMSACEAIARGYGVCRDFAHVMVALCRAVDIPARYVAGHVPLLLGQPRQHDVGIDFHAYVEVYVDGVWVMFDPRHAGVHEQRVKVAHGMDAIDAAIATFAGPVTSLKFEVWAYEVDATIMRLADLGEAVVPSDCVSEVDLAS